MGDAKGAKPLCERVLAIREEVLGPEHPDVAAALVDLARVHEAMNDLHGAKPLYERALAIDEKALGPDHPSTGICVEYLALQLEETGDLQRAKPLLERALAIREKALGPDHPDTAAGLNNLGTLYSKMGDLKGAKPLYERAVAITERTAGPLNPALGRCLENLGSLLLCMGDRAAARPLVERAWEHNRIALHVLLPALTSERRVLMIRSRDFQLGYFLDGFDRDGVRTYDAVLSWKGAALRASAAQMRLPAAASNDARSLVRDLTEARSELARLALAPPGPKVGQDDVPDAYESARKRLDGIEEELSRALPDLAARAFLEPRSKDVQALLPEGCALLDILENCGEVYSWVVRCKGEPEEARLGRATDLAPLVDRFREAIEKDDEKAWKEAGTALRARLARALDAALDGAKTLCISPDGVLATIPWGLLPEKEGFLIERVPIVYSNGGAWMVMASHTAPASKNDGILAIGDVDYGGIEGASPLPATRTEVQHVRERFHRRFQDGRCRVLLGKDATVAAFKEQAPPTRFVHLASHGFFDLKHLAVACAVSRGFSEALMSAPLPWSNAPSMGDPPRVGWNPLLLSGIVLAQGARQESGILTAEEVQDLDLTGVELVVLSACETGRGELAAGEGVLGLSRALSVAGAHAFLLSLWRVPDASTVDLMDGFYEGLWGDAPVSAEEALRGTQLRLLARDRASHEFHPRNWGAWVLIR